MFNPIRLAPGCKLPSVHRVKNHSCQHPHDTGDKGRFKPIKQLRDALVDVLRIEMQKSDNHADEGAEYAQ
ncbi:hypothetical protein D3C76_911690 [compost metagenome]